MYFYFILCLFFFTCIPTIIIFYSNRILYVYGVNVCMSHFFNLNIYICIVYMHMHIYMCTRIYTYVCIMCDNSLIYICSQTVSTILMLNFLYGLHFCSIVIKFFFWRIYPDQNYVYILLFYYFFSLHLSSSSIMKNHYVA